jgi:two-component system phosphate regulon sensor histidine kinase PhoR
MQWPIIVFFACVALVLAQFWWQERRSERLRARAKRAYTETALQQQRDVVAQAQAQQQALFNSMLEGVLLLDNDGHVQLVNESLRKFFEFPAEIRGQKIDQAFRSPELLVLANRLHQEGIFEAELQLPAPRGKSAATVLQVNAAIVAGKDGVTQGKLFVFHDLTRLKQLENLRQEFVANVSHELRTPLSLIKGFAETLLEGAKDNPETATQFLQKIDKHSDRLLFLIEDLLTISKIESGQVALNRQTVEVRELAQRVCDDLTARAASRQIALHNEIPPALLAWADADRLQQVLFNLAENAIKYGRVEGKVTFTGRDSGENRIEVAVADDGSGIPPESIPRIFERFYRVDRARSRETGGTGLGLAIVKHIVQAHGGEVYVKSELEKGATFYFTVPKQAASPKLE